MAPSLDRGYMSIAGQTLARIRSGLNRVLLWMLYRPRHSPVLVRLGSKYGGWWVPPDRLSKDSVSYLAGVGEDASFDLALLTRFGCKIVGIDPTPRSAEYAATHLAVPGYTFLPVGIGGSDRTARFYAPRDPNHVSHSIANLQRTSSYFEAPLMRLRSIMESLGDERVDLLKLDVEGAEHEVIADLATYETLPSILCVEFDQPASLRRTMSSIRTLLRRGYFIARREGFNFTLLQASA